jgi:hypothetical protein
MGALVLFYSDRSVICVLLPSAFAAAVAEEPQAWLAVADELAALRVVAEELRAEPPGDALPDELAVLDAMAVEPAAPPEEVPADEPVALDEAELLVWARDEPVAQGEGEQDEFPDESLVPDDSRVSERAWGAAPWSGSRGPVAGLRESAALPGVAIVVAPVCFQELE